MNDKEKAEKIKEINELKKLWRADIQRAKSEFLEDNLKNAIELIIGERPERVEQNAGSTWFMLDDGIWYYMMVDESFSQEEKNV